MDRLDRRERAFQVWAYTVGMGRLLLRSTKSETFTTRVDVLFQNVKAMNLGTQLDGLVVSRADEPLAARITEETGLLPDEDALFFRVESADRTGYVVAGAMAEDEDSGEYFEPSKYWPGPGGLPAVTA